MAAVVEACDAETGLLWEEEHEDDEPLREEGRCTRGRPSSTCSVASVATVASLATPRWPAAAAAAAAAAEALLPETPTRPRRLLKSIATVGTAFLVIALFCAMLFATTGAAGRRPAAAVAAARPLSGPAAEPLEGVSMEVKALQPQGGPAGIGFADETGEYAAPTVAPAAMAPEAQLQAGQSFAQSSADYGALVVSTPAPPNGVAGFSRETTVDAPVQPPASQYQQAPAPSDIASDPSMLDQNTYSTVGATNDGAGFAADSTEGADFAGNGVSGAADSTEGADLAANGVSGELSAPSLLPASHVAEGLGYESGFASQGTTLSSTSMAFAPNFATSAGEVVAAPPAAEALSYAGGYSSTSLASSAYGRIVDNSDYSGWQGGQTYAGESTSSSSPNFLDVIATTTMLAGELGGVDVIAGQDSVVGNSFGGFTTSSMTRTRTMTTTSTQTTSTQTTSLTKTSTTSTTVKLEGMLFCFAVMMATGYEGPLMKAQLKKGVGIFACEKYSVLSSEEMELSPGPPAKVVTEDIGDLHCNFGGPYNLALNSEIFARAWKRVFRDGHYKLAAWTVKADPDAVFLPSRLRHLLRGADETASVYLNNCDQGLHGPIEVIALGGMRVFDRNISDCIDSLKHEWTWAGEDVFLRHCLGFVGVNRVDEFKLLSEDHCFNENPAQNGCYSGKVAFHPFKNNKGYFKCLSQAEEQEKKDKHTGNRTHREGKRGGSKQEAWQVKQ